MPNLWSASRGLIERLRHGHLPRLVLRTRALRATNLSITTSPERGPFSYPDSFAYLSHGSDIGPSVLSEEPRPHTEIAMSFLRNLPIVMVEELPQDERTCRICQDPYLDGDEPEEPVYLPCRHIFGGGCINRWLSPEEAEPNSSVSYVFR